MGVVSNKPSFYFEAFRETQDFHFFDTHYFDGQISDVKTDLLFAFRRNARETK